MDNYSLCYLYSRRKYKRFPYFNLAKILINGQEFVVQVHNISKEGIMFTIPDDCVLNVNDEFKLFLIDPDLKCLLDVNPSVKYVKVRNCGCHFISKHREILLIIGKLQREDCPLPERVVKQKKGWIGLAEYVANDIKYREHNQQLEQMNHRKRGN